MVPEIRVLHGGEIAREVARDLASCLASRSRPTRVFEMADYLTSGFDLVDVSEAPETPLESASHAYVLVVETAEFENPADGAVTLLRDLLAANKKTKTTPRRWEVRSVENASQETTRKTASDVADASEPITEPMTRRVRFAVIAVGDTDVMAERAAFRSKQHCASDCNQAGQLADRLFAASGGVRGSRRLETDGRLTRFKRAGVRGDARRARSRARVRGGGRGGGGGDARQSVERRELRRCVRRGVRRDVRRVARTRVLERLRGPGGEQDIPRLRGLDRDAAARLSRGVRPGTRAERSQKQI